MSLFYQKILYTSESSGRNSRMSANLFKKWTYLCLYGLFVVQLTSCYNVDLSTPLVLQPPIQRGIEFGFSLSHIVNGTDRTLLVGAPKANTSQDVESPGALYSCILDDPDPQCRQVTVDTRMADDKYKSYITEDLKGNQGLGSSIAANNKSIVACAPRWHIFDSTSRGTYDLPLGICFAAEAPAFKFKPFSPPFLTGGDLKKSFVNNGSCQFGFSVAYHKNQDSFVSGSPGCWSWQGDTWEVDLDSLETVESYKTAQQVPLTDLDLTPGGDPKSYTTVADLYLGYSVATLIYANTPSIISAMPKTVSTNELNVREKKRVLGPFVSILRADQTNNNRLRIIDTIKPPMNATTKEASRKSMFSYFGYSLTAVDVNGDGLDDVIIGAPFYHNDTHHDQGAIFVYTQRRFKAGGEVKWEYEMVGETDAPRMGSESYGRFGTAVAAIGDIDDDGYQDIAVGAPFLDNSGAVFIYMGSKFGLGEKFSQEIRPSEIPSLMSARGFGFSISQNLNGKENAGIELAVGAHNSDIVAVFRTKNVISLDWTLDVPDQIDLDKKDCLVTSGSIKRHPCVKAQVCMTYNMRRVSPKPKQPLVFEVTLKADVNHAQKRLFFDNNESEMKLNFTLKEGTENCKPWNIMARDNAGQEMKPFMIRAELNFIKQDDDQIVLDPEAKSIKSDELDILVQCEGAEAGLCKSQLELSADILTEYNLDSQKQINVSFTIINNGEPAYNTRLTVTSNRDLLFKASTGDVTSCELKHNIEIICDVDFVIEKGVQKSFVLSMEPSETFFQSLRTHSDHFKVNATVTTTSIIVEPEKAGQLLEIPISVSGTLDLTKNPSDPAKVNYNSSTYYKSPHEAETEEELGPEILHKYQIYNKNDYSIYRTQITIDWPIKVEGKYLLYLLDMPEFEGATPSCNYSNGKVNEFDLQKTKQVEIFGEFQRSPMAGEARMRKQWNSRLNGIKMEIMTFVCTLGEIVKNADVTITMRSRLVQRTIHALEQGTDITDATSSAQLQVLGLPLGAPRPKPSPVSSVATTISYSQDVPEYVVPWWVYLVGGLIGVFILTVIVLILWKCGFFKRNRHDKVDGDEPEKDIDEENVEEEEEEECHTPTTPMLKETDNADDDFFQYSKQRPLDPI